MPAVVKGESDSEALAERQINDLVNGSSKVPAPTPNKALAERQFPPFNLTAPSLSARNLSREIEGTPVTGFVGMNEKRADAATPSAAATLAVHPDNFQTPSANGQ